MSRRSAVTAAAVVVLLAVGLWLIGPPRGRVAEDGPEGTLAFRHLLEELGRGGRESDRPPSDGTFVLLEDLRDPDQAREVLAWVQGGGRLVVAAPGSPIPAELGLEPGRLVGGGLTGSAELAADCAVPELAGVATVAVRVSDRRLRLPARDLVGCLAGGGEAFLVVVPHGQGRVVVLAGASPLTNELLDRADNAALAARLAGPGPVVLGTPRPAASDPVGPWSAIPAAAKAVLAGLLLAGATLAAARGRRLGMPPDEAPPSPLPASALVDATASLYRSSGDRGHVAEVLREAATDRLRRRWGLDPAASRADVVAVAADRRGTDRADVRRLLDGPVPADDRELLTLSRDLDHLLRPNGRDRP